MSDTGNQDRHEASWDSSNQEELYQILFEEASDGIFITDPQGRFVAFNPRGIELTGYSREDLLGLNFTALFPPEDLVRDPIRMDDLRQGKIVIKERRIRRKDDSLLPVEISARMLPAGNLLGIVRDITERKLAERALRQSEERMRLALRAANQGFYDLNVQTGEAQVSPEYASMLGYDPAEFHETNAAWIERLHPEDHEPVAAIYHDYIAGKIPEYRVEFRQRTKSGDWKWILSLGKIVERDAQAKPLRMLGTHTDITERKSTEDALRRSEKRLRALIDSAPFGAHLYELDEYDRLVFRGYNQSANRILGVDNAQFLGKTIVEAFPPLAATEIPASTNGRPSLARNTKRSRWTMTTVRSEARSRSTPFRPRPGGWPPFLLTSPSAKRLRWRRRSSRPNCCNRRRWSRWGGWPAAWPTISTTCFRRSWAMPNWP